MTVIGSAPKVNSAAPNAGPEIAEKTKRCREAEEENSASLARTVALLAIPRRAVATSVRTFARNVSPHHIFT